VRPSLRDLQARFAAALLDGDAADTRVGAYRDTVVANYRNALGATYRVVRELTGAPFFNTAVDAFAVRHPSTGGDLNVYGGEFADFLASYPYGRELAYLADVARLEWSLDEAHRAADPSGSPQEVLAALAQIPGPDVARQRFVLDPSCRFLRSPHPVLRIWQVHQPDHAGDGQVDLRAGADHLLIRREAATPVVERLAAGDFAFLSSLAAGADLAAALDAALTVEATFDLGTALRAYIASGVIMAVAS
jgi:hypothetical protein